MKNYDATEQAYKNGYKKGYEEGFKEGYEGGVDVGKRNAVKRGRWEEWCGLPRCPVCGYEYTDYLECKNYCGNCGADMRGEEE
jgi:hypothetical protein